MEPLIIICVDDQRDVLSVVVRDLQQLEPYVILEPCESADEALALIDELDAEGKPIALIVSDHVMPNKTGVEFLSEIQDDTRFKFTRKILLTGQATHQDTIAAINRAGIDHYMEKPWQVEQLIGNAKELLTEYVIRAGIDYQPYMNILDQTRLYRHLS